MNEQRYLDELRALSGRVHGRNAQLVRLSLLGLAAGRDRATLADEIIAAGGEPSLSASEVNRAISAAERRFCENKPNFRISAPTRTILPRNELRRGLNAREVGFVREMIERGNGAKGRDLIELSQTNLGTVPNFEAFLKALYRPDELLFAGTPYLPRTRENLKTAAALSAALSEGKMALPTHFAANPFTGEAGRTSEGKESYCLEATVASRRYALIEFDALPLAQQVEFWVGVLRARLLPVRSLVYSGAKSIHGLVELEEDGSAAKWTEQWKTLERLLCSDPDRNYHADRACKNAARFTRFPGAIRPETGHVQRLLYLD